MDQSRGQKWVVIDKAEADRDEVKLAARGERGEQCGRAEEREEEGVEGREGMEGLAVE